MLRHMGKLKDVVEGVLKRRPRSTDPKPKQLDRWADEGGALPPDLHEDPETR